MMREMATARKTLRIALFYLMLLTPKTRKDQHALFRAGFFEPVKPGITDMVQLPDVLGMTVEGYTPANYHQALDMRKGIFTQTWQERGLTVSMLRIASMADPQLLCVRMALTSEWDQTVTVQARMDDRVANLPVHDDQMVEETETVPLLKTLEKTNDTLTMQAVSSGRHIRFLQQVRLHEESVSGFIFDIPLRAGKTTVIEKRVRVLLDRETPNIESSDPWQAHTSPSFRHKRGPGLSQYCSEPWRGRGDHRRHLSG